MDAPPQKVVALAGSRGLGAHTHTRKGENPLGNLLFCIVGAAVLFGLSALAAWITKLTEIRAIGILTILLALGGLFAFAFGFFMLMRGFSALYVFQSGVVWTQNGSAQSATWGELESLTIARIGEDGEPHGGALVTLDGRSIQFVTRMEEGRDPLVEHLTAAMRHFGRPVLDTGDGPEQSVYQPETSLQNLTLARICAVGGVIGSIALAVLLHVAGLPGPLSAIIGPFLVGLGVIAVGVFIDPRVVRAGQVFIGVSFLVVLLVVIKVFPYNGFLEAGVVLAIEGIIVAVFRKVWVKLPMPRKVGARQKLARRNGWAFVPEATVPVGGPQTVTRLFGVPTGAAHTTGHAVVSGSANAMTFTVYDRLRRPPRMTDRIQTVWVVHLPMALPFVSSRDIVQGSGDEATRAIATPQLVHALQAGALPEFWIEGPFLYSTQLGLPPGAIGPRVDALTRTAVALPWPALQRFARSLT
ncbi:hypothetical protein Val02_33350 [Virgisporangium aliadipatigenens]|uniref:Uncharacterized protein n=1 Tax=Virgisporangium aliadipatigenens TaxID=741659 RepID=A0A8J4DQC1_9ACTN|nr:hypothetical protein [Virgisporangium aliadipatigenens]GIJ46449.1 hypothetical protein Val02_33350 [Virgisporangium aliadipatigenens]